MFVGVWFVWGGGRKKGEEEQGRAGGEKGHGASSKLDCVWTNAHSTSQTLLLLLLLLLVAMAARLLASHNSYSTNTHPPYSFTPSHTHSYSLPACHSLTHLLVVEACELPQVVIPCPHLLGFKTQQARVFAQHHRDVRVQHTTQLPEGLDPLQDGTEVKV